tara:strand:- start:14800 stop:15612 length:813 start_codon:yes stop_codon:yes gene_type:complete
MSASGGWGTPGLGAVASDTPKEILWSGTGCLYKSVVIDSATADAGNTPTTLLRAGLILGKVTSTGQYSDYDADAIDGTQIAEVILAEEINTLDHDANAVDRVFQVVTGGAAKAGQLLLLDEQARKLLGNRFTFDDDLPGRSTFLGPAVTDVAKATDYTLVAADSGKRFVCDTADCNFTLPAIATSAGFTAQLVMMADFELAVTSAEGDNILAINDASADSVTFTTAGQQIGVIVDIAHFHYGAVEKWMVTYRNAAFGTGLTGGVTLGIVT